MTEERLKEIKKFVENNEGGLIGVIVAQPMIKELLSENNKLKDDNATLHFLYEGSGKYAAEKETEVEKHRNLLECERSLVYSLELRVKALDENLLELDKENQKLRDALQKISTLCTHEEHNEACSCSTPMALAAGKALGEK